MLCASVEIQSYFQSETLLDVYAMIYEHHPNTGYNGYGPEQEAQTPASFIRLKQPSLSPAEDSWHFGDLAPGESREMVEVP